MDFSRAKMFLDESLEQADRCAFDLLSEYEKESITVIISGSHLTFRYMLITALLAKVVDEQIHMRSLQVKSSLIKAYDARSLCHKIFVPFEKTKLQGRLGSSNEPFLNKPARFPEISCSNPSREGRDKKLQATLYKLLELLNLTSKEKQKQAFYFAIRTIKQRPSSLAHSLTFTKASFLSSDFSKAIDIYLSTCSGGESATSALGAFLQSCLYSNKAKIKVHPVNQAGTSSNEIGDIDVYLSNAFFYAIEVKDKMFSRVDVEHAVQKVKSSGNNKLIFAIGKHGQHCLDSAEQQNLCLQYAKEGFDCSFVSVEHEIISTLAFLHENSCRLYILEIAKILDGMRATDATKKHFKETFKHFLV